MPGLGRPPLAVSCHSIQAIFEWTPLVVLQVEHSGDPSAFTDQDIKRAGGGRGVHYFEADTTAGQRKHEIPGWQDVFVTGAQDDQLGTCLEQQRQIAFD